MKDRLKKRIKQYNENKNKALSANQNAPLFITVKKVDKSFKKLVTIMVYIFNSYQLKKKILHNNFISGFTVEDLTSRD